MNSEKANQSVGGTANPLVTAIVLCYNHERFVVEALESVRAQTYPNIQLIIIDDCSRDKSPHVIRGWIRANAMDCLFLQNERNLGICPTLNRALRHVKGKYLAIFASDDVWLPEKTETQVRLLEQASSSVAVAFSDAFQMDESGRDLPEMFIAAHRRLPEIPSGRIFDVLWEGNFIPAMSTLVRRDALLDVGEYDEELVFEDWDMWLRLSLKYEFLYCTRPLAKYRIVATSMVRSRAAEVIRSSVVIRLKLRERGVLSAAQRVSAVDTLLEYAKQAYYAGARDSGKWLRKSLAKRFEPWLAFLFVCSLLGLPVAWILRVRESLRFLKPLPKRIASAK